MSLFFSLSPAYFFARSSPGNILHLFIFLYLGFFIAAYIMRFKSSNRLASLRIDREKAEEARNSLSLQLRKTADSNNALSHKISGYMDFSLLAEGLAQASHIEEVSALIINTAYDRVASGKGNCLLYLVDNQSQQLKLFASRKEDSSVVIKAKKGDIFDQWVLRQCQPLIIEDIRKDFRFDFEKGVSENEHLLSSLVCVPLVSSGRILGLLRRDSPGKGEFSLDDLRLLKAIGDFGAVALENAQLYERTEQLATHDGLTGIYVRRYFTQRLKEEVSRGEGNVFSLIFADIDHFKTYNDKYGHTAGDIVLKKITGIFSEICEERSGIVARLGGEEFAVLAPRISRDQAFALAERLRNAVEKKEIILRREPTRVKVSLGVAEFPLNASTAEGMIEAADNALYAAKNKGRNRVCCA